MVMKRNQKRTEQVIQQLITWKNERTGIFENASLPENLLPQGVEKGSYEHIMFITMCSSIDYQRNADEMWDAGRKTWNDEKTRWVFFPKLVKQKTLENLVIDLQKYKLSKKRDKDAGIWRTVSLSFLERFDGDPRNLFRKFEFDAIKIRDYMRKLGAGVFPYLAGSTSGGKINSMWIRILHDDAGISFRNYENMPLPIDIHTMRATITTGCLIGKFHGSFQELTGMAKNAWAEACENLTHSPLDLDEALFNLSRLGCSKIKNGECPFISECKLAKFCITKNPDSKFELNSTEGHIDTHYPSD